MADDPNDNVYRSSRGRRSTTSQSSTPSPPESVVKNPSHERHTTDEVGDRTQSSVSTNASNIRTSTSTPVTTAQNTSILRSTSSARRQSRRRTSSDRLTNLSYRASSVAKFMVSAEEVGSILAEILDFIPEEKFELVAEILAEAERYGKINFEVFNQLDLLGSLTTAIPSFNNQSVLRDNIEPRVQILSRRFDNIDALSPIAETTPLQRENEDGNRNQPIPGDDAISSSGAATEQNAEENNVHMRDRRSSRRGDRSSYQSRPIEKTPPEGINVSTVAASEETDIRAVPMRHLNTDSTIRTRQSLDRSSIRGGPTSFESTTTDENVSGKENNYQVVSTLENENETHLPILRPYSGRRCTARESAFRSPSQPLTEQDRGNRISAAISRRVTLTSGPFIVSAEEFSMLVDDIIDYIPDENRELLDELLLTAKLHGQIDYKAFDALNILQFVQTPITETIPEETDADDTEWTTLPARTTSETSVTAATDEAAIDCTEVQVIESIHVLQATPTSDDIEDVAANADANIYTEENVTEHVREMQTLPTIEHTDNYAANSDKSDYEEEQVPENVHEIQAPAMIEYADDSAANVDAYSIPPLAECTIPLGIRIQDNTTYEPLVIDRRNTGNTLIDEDMYDTDDLLNTEVPDDLTHIPMNDQGLLHDPSTSSDEEICTVVDRDINIVDARFDDDTYADNELTDYSDDSNGANERHGTIAEEYPSDTMDLVNMPPLVYIHSEDDRVSINQPALHTEIPRIHHVIDDELSDPSEASIPVEEVTIDGQGSDVDADDEGADFREDDQDVGSLEHDDGVEETNDTADMALQDTPSLGRDIAAEQMHNLFENRNPQHQQLDQTEAAAEAIDSLRTEEEYMGELAEFLPQLTRITLRRHVTAGMTDVGVVDRRHVFNSLHEVEQKSLRRWILQNKLPGTILININQQELLYSLLLFYKQASAEEKKEKLKKIPRLRFEGESGIDAGALTREFFSHGMESFFKGPAQDGPIFEGAPDHRIPCVSIIHRESNVYQTFGTFLAHSLLHGCGGAVGLAPCIKAVLSSNMPLEIKSLRSNIEISIDDVPDFELQEWLRKIQDTPSEVNTRDSTFVQYVVESGFFSGTLRSEHHHLLLHHLLIYFVIIKRRAELEEIREGMNQLDLYKFLCGNHTVENVEDVFPSLADFVLTPDDITNRLDTSHVRWSPKLQFFQNFLKELHEGKHDGVGLSELMQFWTGSSTPPPNLELKLQHSGPFPLAHACFNLLELPAMCATYKDFVDNFVTALTCGARGFGMA